MVAISGYADEWDALFQYSLCRVVLMVHRHCPGLAVRRRLSVLALSSRFDGPAARGLTPTHGCSFQYSLCRVVLMVLDPARMASFEALLSVLALSSRFDGHDTFVLDCVGGYAFSTRSVESF